MTTLITWHENDPDQPTFHSSNRDDIRVELDLHGVRYEHHVPVTIDPSASSEEILQAHREMVDAISSDENYVTVDVARLHPVDSDEWRSTALAARQKFLNEHTHDDDEVRYFVDGSGIFYLHIGQKVHAVLCTAGDLLDVPANTTHWFDMGSQPDFIAIRFFKVDDGWIGNFTGNDIASRFPDFDTISRSVAASA